MKVAFWSNGGKAVGVTTNLACIAAMNSIDGSGKTLVMENHYSIKNLGSMILPEERMICFKESGKYFQKYGMEHVMKQISAGKKSQKLIRETAVPLLFSNISYLPQSFIVNQEIFNYEFEEVCNELFGLLEEVSDYVLIDTQSVGNLSGAEIIEQADLIVVNLLQDTGMIEDFFKNYGALKERCVFLVGEYERGLHLTIHRICQRYHIERNKIGIIPFNLELQECIRNGKLLQFINRNHFNPSGIENEYFMKHTRKAAAMIRKQMELIEDK